MFHRALGTSEIVNQNAQVHPCRSPLVKNLYNPDYVKIILDSFGTLEERFAKIDSDMVVKQLKIVKKHH
jgi:hypothetical protein